MRQPISLEQIRVSTPCEMAWDNLRGDERVRYCEKCNLHVHNLSAMTTDELATLIDGVGAQRTCIAYRPTPTGAPMTLDYAKPKRRFTLRWTVIVGVIGAAVATVGQIFLNKPRSQMPSIVMGDFTTVPIQSPPPASTATTTPAAP